MKKLINKLLGSAVKHHLSWSFLNSTFIRISNHLKWQREEYEESLIKTAIESKSKNCMVMHGPFKRMKYPELKAFGSTLFPKLLGSYEKELQPLIETLCLAAYSEIVNIGCAEGYYAVGLAQRIKHAKVFAYDLNREALAACANMAQINGVKERLITGMCCDINTIKSIPFSQRALIVSDCEGDEKNLFADEIASLLSNHDMLIEIHGNEIAQLLKSRFQSTHSIMFIPCIDDLTKAKTYSFPELDGYKLAERMILLAELRQNSIGWFFMTPHNNPTKHPSSPGAASR